MSNNSFLCNHNSSLQKQNRMSNIQSKTTAGNTCCINLKDHNFISICKKNATKQADKKISLKSVGPIRTGCLLKNVLRVICVTIDI